MSPSQVRIVALVKQGVALPAIAEQLGLSPSTVRKSLARARLMDETLPRVDPNANRNPKWDQILDLWNANLTSGQIQSRIGVSRGAVMGVISRARMSGIKVRTPRPDRVTRVKSPRKVTVEKDEPKPVRQVYPRLKRLSDTEPEYGDGVSLFDLNENSCRYVTGRRNGEHLFCTDVRKDHRTRYCTEHHKLVWVKNTTKLVNATERDKIRREMRARNAPIYGRALDGR